MLLLKIIWLYILHVQASFIAGEIMGDGDRWWCCHPFLGFGSHSHVLVYAFATAIQI